MHCDTPQFETTVTVSYIRNLAAKFRTFHFFQTSHDLKNFMNNLSQGVTELDLPMRQLSTAELSDQGRAGLVHLLQRPPDRDGKGGVPQGEF